MKEKQKVVEVTPEDDRSGEEDRGGRETWDNQCEFFLSCLGYAVGFGNVWRFPYLAYKNGGAVFFIPYVIMLLCTGLPLFFLELCLGQFSSLGPNKVFLHLSPIFMGVGWGMMMISLLVAIYYNVILAWSIFYTFASFTSELPWGHCENDFNSANCFTLSEGARCANSSMYFYNKTCVDLNEYCGISNLLNDGNSSCVDPTNSSNLISTDKAVKTISASEDFFKHRMLGLTDDTTWSNMGELRWELVGCLALAWVIVGASLIKGVKSSGKVVYFTAIFPYVVLVILFFRGVTLEGAYTGIEFYILKPDLSKLGTVEIWADAATQIFYSLGSAFGALITLASYNKFRNNCMRDAIIIAMSNCCTSIFAGFVIFSFLGFMAVSQGTTVPELVTSGSGLAFVVYAEAVTKMPLPPLWAILFFFMLITLGLDSQFSMVETLTTAIFDQWPSMRDRKAMVVITLCVGLFLGGFTMVLQGGMFMFELFNFYSAGISVLVMAILEIVIVNYFYGFKKMMSHVTNDMGIYVPLPLYGYWAVTWCFITPVTILVILGMSIAQFTPAYVGDYVFPTNIQALGWAVTFASILCIPGFAIYILVKGDHRGKELIQASPDFCPAHVRAKREKDTQGFKPDGTFKYIYDNEGYQEGVAKVYPRIPNGAGATIDSPPPYTPGHM